MSNNWINIRLAAHCVSKMQDRLDILIWRDGFWCFREEFRMDWLRDDDCRVIETEIDEWLEIARKRPLFVLPA